MIPDSATATSLWSYLGWDEEASRHYKLAKAYGVDIRPILAPVFNEVVSLVADADVKECPKLRTSWDDILSGQVPAFKAETPKKTVLSVINYALRQQLV